MSRIHTYPNLIYLSKNAVLHTPIFMHILRDLGSAPTDLAISSAIHQTNLIAAGRRQVWQQAPEYRERGVRSVCGAVPLEARQQRLVGLDCVWNAFEKRVPEWWER